LIESQSQCAACAVGKKGSRKSQADDGMVIDLSFSGPPEPEPGPPDLDPCGVSEVQTSSS